jgi:hypothetical protein
MIQWPFSSSTSKTAINLADAVIEDFFMVTSLTWLYALLNFFAFTAWPK